MHKSLEIIDLLQVIFQYTDRASDASCVRVCRAWHECALDALWHHIDRLDVLLNILSPLAEVSDNIMTFPNYHIPASGWSRFLFYAKRIRHVEHTEHKGPSIHVQSFATIAISRPVLHLVPNLVRLTWSRDPDKPVRALPLSLLFIHPGLKHLDVFTGTVADQNSLHSIDNFLDEVLLRAPDLEHFSFQSDIPYRKLGPHLGDSLRSLRRLKIVTLSDAHLTSEVVTALGHCPSLEAIRLHSCSGNPDNLIDVENFCPVAMAASFPCIREVALTTHLWNISHFLQSDDFPANRLRALHVKTLQNESPDVLRHFCEALAAECPDIESISLSIPFQFYDDTMPLIPFSSLAPLLDCKRLTELNIPSVTPLELDDSHAIQMAQSWPHLQKLSLNSGHFHSMDASTTDQFTLYATIPFAENCPNLRSLSLTVDAARIPSVNERKHLRFLKTFNISVTSSDFSTDDLALFLADITPLDCAVQDRSRVEQYFQLLEGLQDPLERTQRLEMALSMLPMLRNVHASYQRRICALATQVSQLQAHHNLEIVR